MNRKVIWLVTLLLLWTSVGVLWMGFTLPEITGYSPFLEEIEAYPNRNNRGVQATNEKSFPDGVPPAISSTRNSVELDMDRKQVELWYDWIQKETGSRSFKMIVTGYQLSSENKHTALGRAKAFQSRFDQFDSIDMVLVEEYRDNISLHGDDLRDVIGVSLVERSSPIKHDFTLETSPGNLINEKEYLARLSSAIQSSQGNYVELTFCVREAYNSLEKNRRIIRNIKDELKEFGIPRHKIIGNLEECKLDTGKIILQIK